MNNIRRFWLVLLYWYCGNKRDFPWRNTKSAYEILVAEMLLQQTHVRKVVDVYNQITRCYPTPYALSVSSIDELTLTMQPLGLRYRAERLIKVADIICRTHNGRVPKNKKSLVELPGVGDYIAEAVRCYAFNCPTVPIDTNVIRLFTRYFGMVSSKKRARCDHELISSIRSCFMFKNTRTTNLAVLDYASAVCTAKTPGCTECLLYTNCTAVQDGISKDL